MKELNWILLMLAGIFLLATGAATYAYAFIVTDLAVGFAMAFAASVQFFGAVMALIIGYLWRLDSVEQNRH